MKRLMLKVLLAFLIVLMGIVYWGCYGTDTQEISFTAKLIDIEEYQVPQSWCDWAKCWLLKFDNGARFYFNISATRFVVGQTYSLTLHRAKHIIGDWNNLSDGSFDNIEKQYNKLYEPLTMILLSDNLTPYPFIIKGRLIKQDFSLGNSYFNNNRDWAGQIDNSGICIRVLLSNNVVYWIPYDFPLPIDNIEYEWITTPAGEIVGYR